VGQAQGAAPSLARPETQCCLRTQKLRCLELRSSKKVRSARRRQYVRAWEHSASRKPAPGEGALLVWVPQTRTRSSAARTKQTKPLRVGANHAFYLLVCEAALRHSKQKTLDQRRHLQCASMIHSHLARGVLELCLHDVRAARDCAEHGLNQSACMRRNDTVTSPVASGGASGGNLLSGHREPPTGTCPP
jgi:hypothetical protein